MKFRSAFLIFPLLFWTAPAETDRTAALLGHVIPAYVGFGIPEYAVAAGESEAVITVVRHGEFREAAAVRFYTAEPDPPAGELAYEPVETWVEFAPGEGFRTVTIPLRPVEIEGQQKVELRLADPDHNVFITEERAVLLIVNPRLNIRSAPGEAVRVSWPAALWDYLLERSNQAAGGSWEEVEAALQSSDDGLQVFVLEPVTQPRYFYRLRRRY
jgi:hypothetical protein